MTPLTLRLSRSFLNSSAEEIFATATRVVQDARKPGFFKYTNGYAEMVYNPQTKEVWHMMKVAE